MFAPYYIQKTPHEFSRVLLSSNPRHHITLKLRSTPCCFYETLASKHSKFRGEIVRSLGKTYKTIKFYFVLLVARGQNLISNSNRVGRRKMMTNNEKKKKYNSDCCFVECFPPFYARTTEL